MSHKIKDCKVIAETTHAILVESENFEDEKEWVPQSQIDDDSEVWEKGQG